MGFAVDEFYIIITVVPAKEPDEVRKLMGGTYSNYINDRPYLSQWDQSAQNFINWIYCYDNEDGINGNIHLQSFTCSKDAQDIPSILASDILTSEELPA